MNSINNNNNNEAKNPQQPFIRGMGSAIPGIGDERIAGGKGGTLIHVSDVLYYLTKNYQLHNPKTGKVIDKDWARRNLGMEFISCANVEHAKSIQEEIGIEHLTRSVADDAVSLSEDELRFVAFDEALERAKLKPKDIDLILSVSGTQGDVYFWENMRVWKRQYPDLRDDVQMQHHPIGCPAFLYELKLAQQLLCSPDINNIAIVISNVGSTISDREYFELHAHENKLMHWANLVLFGDGASSVILSTDTTNPLPAQVYDLKEVEYKIDNDTWISKREDRATVFKDGQPSSTRPVYSLNVEGPKLIKGAVDHWNKVLRSKHGFKMKNAKHVALHSPNPKVLRTLGKHYGITDKLSFLPDDIGNLGPASCVTNLHHRIYKSGIATNDTDMIYGFAIGATLGALHGVYLLEARDTTKSPVIEKSEAVSSDTETSFANDIDEFWRFIFVALWGLLCSIFKRSIVTPAPSRTKALRRISSTLSQTHRMAT